MYWESKGRENTELTIELALKRAEELGIKHIVAASNSGYTIDCLLQKGALERGLHVVCVTHHVGFEGPGEDEMPLETRKRLKESGVEILTTTHLLAGVDRALRLKFGGVYPAEIMAQTLRIMGQGLKVCVEIACMSLDAGLIPYGQEVIAIAGTGSGADTAIVITPAHSNQFFDTRVNEIICKPRNF